MTRVGLATIAADCTANILLLSAYTDKDSLLDAIQTQSQFNNSSGNLTACLYLVTNYLLAEQNGGRPNVPSVLTIVTSTALLAADTNNANLIHAADILTGNGNNLNAPL
jgi:hypothetical protein